MMVHSGLYRKCWLIVPLLVKQVSELPDFIRLHQWYFDGGGNAIFKISGRIKFDKNIYFDNPNILTLAVPDTSLYDAWNQAFDYLERLNIHDDSYVSFLGMDDVWSEGFVSESMGLTSRGTAVDFIFGRSRHFFNNRYFYLEPPQKPKLFGSDYFKFDVPHPGMLNKWRSVAGFRFDSSFELAADLDFYIGISVSRNLSYKKLDCLQATLGAEGVSNSKRSKEIYLREWAQIEKKRNVRLDLDLGRVRTLAIISRCPFVFEKMRAAWWFVKGKKY